MRQRVNDGEIHTNPRHLCSHPLFPLDSLTTKAQPYCYLNFAQFFWYPWLQSYRIEDFLKMDLVRTFHIPDCHVPAVYLWHVGRHALHSWPMKADIFCFPPSPCLCWWLFSPRPTYVAFDAFDDELIEDELLEEALRLELGFLDCMYFWKKPIARSISVIPGYV